MAVHRADIENVLKARATIGAIVSILTVVEHSLMQCSVAVAQASSMWPAGLDEKDAIALESSEYDMEKLRDEVRRFIRHYAPIAYGETTGWNRSEYEPKSDEVES